MRVEAIERPDEVDDICQVTLDKSVVPETIPYISKPGSGIELAMTDKGNIAAVKVKQQMLNVCIPVFR